MTIERYVHALRRWLGSGPRAQRIVDEVTGHLEDAAASMRHRGMPVEESERASVSRFGSAARVALEFYWRTPLVLVERIEPFALFASTLVTLLFAGAATFFTMRAVLTEGGNIWSLVQLALACAFAWVVLFVWFGLAIRKAPVARIGRVGGFVVLGLGLAGVCLATWSGLTSGDWEYYLYVMHGNLAFMGGLMCRWFSRDQSSRAGRGVTTPSR